MVKRILKYPSYRGTSSREGSRISFGEEGCPPFCYKLLMSICNSVVLYWALTSFLRFLKKKPRRPGIPFPGKWPSWLKDLIIDRVETKKPETHYRISLPVWPSWLIVLGLIFELSTG